MNARDGLLWTMLGGALVAVGLFLGGFGGCVAQRPGQGPAYQFQSPIVPATAPAPRNP